MNNTNKNDFYSNTISGVELLVKFAFPKAYFTKDIADAKKKVFFDIGTVTVVRWGSSAAADAKSVLSSPEVQDLASGAIITQGDMGFKVFHKDSLAVLKEEILKGINNGEDTIGVISTDDNPFITLEDDMSFTEETDAEDIEWVQMPFFDILLISTASDNNDLKKVRMMEIKDVKLYSEGFAEGIQSLEVNSLVSFMALGGTTDWEEYE